MTSDKVVYPDISDILARKRRGREKLASLSFAEKLRILERLREPGLAFRRARKKRTQEAPSSAG